MRDSLLNSKERDRALSILISARGRYKQHPGGVLLNRIRGQPPSRISLHSVAFCASSNRIVMAPQPSGDRAPCRSRVAVRATHGWRFDRAPPTERDMSMERNSRRRTPLEFRHRGRAEPSRTLCQKSSGTSPPSCNRYPHLTAPKVA